MEKFKKLFLLKRNTERAPKKQHIEISYICALIFQSALHYFKICAATSNRKTNITMGTHGNHMIQLKVE